MLELVERICSSVCHALPERTFFFGGRPLPLCARCTGVYLGFLLTMAWFACTRLRDRKLVPRALLRLVIAVIVLFAVLGFAGLHGLLSLTNDSRLAIGLFFGSALGVLAFPLTREWLLGMTSQGWERKDTYLFLALPIVLLGVGLAVHGGLSFLFWPLAIAVLLGLVGSHFLADLLILSWLLCAVRSGKRGQAPFVRSTLWAVPAKGACPLFPASALAALMCAGEFLFYSAWRHWWQVL